jgi:hypothetical protein
MVEGGLGGLEERAAALLASGPASYGSRRSASSIGTAGQRKPHGVYTKTFRARRVTRVNSTNVQYEGLRIGGIGRQMNSKVKSVK